MQAVAEAFAYGFVSATDTCVPSLCTTDASFLSEALGEVLAEAASAAVFEQCAGTAPQRLRPLPLPHRRILSASQAWSHENC